MSDAFGPLHLHMQRLNAIQVWKDAEWVKLNPETLHKEDKDIEADFNALAAASSSSSNSKGHHHNLSHHHDALPPSSDKTGDDTALEDEFDDVLTVRRAVQIIESRNKKDRPWRDMGYDRIMNMARGGGRGRVGSANTPSSLAYQLGGTIIR